MEMALSGSDTWTNEQPIRDEIFSVERLEQIAATLASEHEVSKRLERGQRLLPRFEDNGRRLITSYKSLTESNRASNRALSPAAAWLVDNFHVVDEQLRQIREDLPESYYNELPKLSTGDMRGYPRIYAIAVTIIAHTDSRLDRDLLRRFIAAYQQVTPLTIGELWAVAITLRLALVENLRRSTVRVVVARAEREEADRLADDLLESTEVDQRTVVAALIRRLAKRKAISGPFVVQLTRRLRDQNTLVTPLVEWVEAEMQRRGERIEDVVQLEHHRQAASQVTVGNIITSMKLLSTVEWPVFVESVNLSEPILASDPAGAYSDMDFETRDRYRHVIERVARKTGVDELQIARRAVELASRNQSLSDGKFDTSRKTHVGYFLIDGGLEELEREFGFRPSVRQRVRRVILRHATGFYLGLIGTLTPLIVALLVYSAAKGGGTPFALLVTALMGLIPAADLAVSLLNWDITHTLAPRVLPKMNSEHPVPVDGRTMIVVPSMLSSERAVKDLVERLEVHYLANQDPEFFFALLSDFVDAPDETTPEDDILLETAIAGIERLNHRYGPTGERRFFIFHRRRLWNESEGKWIAWERKRGKLEEFNRLLRGAWDTSFEVVQGDAALLSSVRYVITLDSDTQLPRDAARKLVATIRHPLNRAVLDPDNGRVVSGYGILQPRIGVTLESSVRSQFARIFGGSAGIDPYGTAASDVYQDLFGEGSFTGKGLYDVDAFQAALNSRVPDNALLSHDLFEGLYARSALITDIELFDDHPARYDAWAKRQHRWTRGDWQIAGWLLRRVPTANGGRVRNVLPLISRWKILDNLRRSVVPTFLVFWLVGAWTYLPGSPLSSTIFALLVAAFPVYAQATTNLFTRPKGVPWLGYFSRIRDDFALNLKRVALTVAFLPHQAQVTCDAIIRVAYRKLISGRHLLEWMTAAQVERGSRDQLAAVRSMYPVTGFALASAILIGSVRPDAVLYAVLFLLGWAASPLLAYLVSRPNRPEQRMELTHAERVRMRMIARSTWRFFETFVGDEDHWLPPDNFQEVPTPLIAHRTSPTNIGLLLLSTVSAREFGYIGLLEMIERLDLTLATLSRMERYEGHFLNWYDTRTLSPLLPKYVSTVDSGNLAGHLLATKQAALEISHRKVVDQRALDGLSDTLAHLTQESLRSGLIKERGQVVTVRQMTNEVARALELVAAMSATTGDASAWGKLLDGLSQCAGLAGDIARGLEVEQGPGGVDTFAEWHLWIGLLTNQIRALRCDVDLLMPFDALSNTPLTRLLEDTAPELVTQWRTILDRFAIVPTIAQIESDCEAGLEDIRAMTAELTSRRKETPSAILPGLEAAAALIERAGFAAFNLRERGRVVAQACGGLIQSMNFQFLFDEDRKLFVIGFNVSEGRRDQSFYDLLASEARLTSLMAIAKGDVPQEHWFRLGRRLTQVEGKGRALVSWAGTMFEYLMPLIVTEDYAETLLHQTYRTVVARQMAYGREHDVPWGVSESAFHARDLQLNYQYGPFGVPGLGIKRGLSEDLVIAPYATCLAAMIDPQDAVENMLRLEQSGALSRYGFYEAIDYTPDRLPQNSTKIVINSFMTHHQGMSLVSLDNVLHNEVMRKRFHSDPMIQATELLLQERVPQNVGATSFRQEEVLEGRLVNTLTEPVAVAYDSASLPTPRTQLISNGRYSVMVTSAGSGSSTCALPGTATMAVTRWREDVTRDNWGSFCYLRDVKSGAIWSSGYQPTARRPQSYEVSFTEERAVFTRMDWGILTRTDIVVSPEDDAEVRCVTITNRSSKDREIELTSYSEIVLATAAADTAHRAFSNLFVETEFIAAESTLIARRRQRSPDEPSIYAMHTIVTEGDAVGAVQYETSRERFLGRGHETRLPLALIEEKPLSKTVGAVLDPVFSLRQRVRLKPNETARITFSTVVAPSREQILVMADKYHDVNIFERVERLAWTHAHVQMRHLNIEPREAHLFQRLGGRVLYCDSSLRARSDILARNQRTQSDLWKYGIGGDIPIVLIRIKIGTDIELLR
ncbi:MAG: glucoamylase family protein, partial [Acidobacteriota bacterium]